MKNARDMPTTMNWSYRQTKIEENDASHTKVGTSRVHAIKDYKTMGTDGRMEFFIETEFVTNGSASQSRIVIKTIASEAMDDAGFTSMNISRARKLQWTGFSVGYQKKKSEVEITNHIQTNTIGKVRYGSVEELTIPLQLSDLLNSVRVGSGIFILLNSEASADKRIQIPFAYLVGYLAKLSENGFLEQNERSFVLKLQSAINDMN